ncbi:MAG: tetratricopeptide repeat protein [Spirosomataceae bacterium]
MKSIKNIRSIVVLILISQVAHAQLFSWFSGDDKNKKREMLMANRAIQIEMTAAMNNMYNFNFDAAERDFKWLTIKYPDHPIGYFLLGLNEWWKIVPDTKVTKYDDACEAYMDKAIDLAEEIYDDDESNKEAAFFMAAAYAFKGRLHTERERWVKAAYVGKQAMKYLERSRGFGDFSPELYMGDGLYNYYSKWIPENYPSLKPLLVFFRKGNKNEGIKQLEYVSLNAFYTRMESRYFLVQIYSMERQDQKAYNMARMMHSTFPDNSFFHRYAARTAFMLGKADEAETYAKELLDNIAKNKYGYEGTAGRYAAYILGYINYNYRNNLPEAKKYYLQTIDFAKSTNATDSGYYLGANLSLGKIAKAEGDLPKAIEYFKIAEAGAEKKSDTKKEAQKLIDETKKLMKKAKK